VPITRSDVISVAVCSVELNVLFVRAVIEIVLTTVTASIEVCVEMAIETEVTADISFFVGGNLVSVPSSSAKKAYTSCG
jgi:hypothetical protein